MSDYSGLLIFAMGGDLVEGVLGTSVDKPVATVTGHETPALMNRIYEGHLLRCETPQMARIGHAGPVQIRPELGIKRRLFLRLCCPALQAMRVIVGLSNSRLLRST